MNTKISRSMLNTAWVWLLFFSFAYEKPILQLSSLDKANPRLFDLVIGIGLCLFFDRIKKPNNPILAYWALIVLWFSIVVVLHLLIYSTPWEYERFSLYFLFEYYKELLVVVLLLSVPRSDYNVETIMSAIICAGLFVSIYCFFELTLGSSEITISSGAVLKKGDGLVWGPYTGSYFEIAVFLPISAGICLCKALVGSAQKRNTFLFLSIAISWPIFFTGSRTAIFLWAMTVLLIIFMASRKNITAVLFLSITGVMVYVLTSNYLPQFDVSQIGTISRMQGIEEYGGSNSIYERVVSFLNFDASNYDRETIYILGSGFYISPIDNHYRIGFGVHNIYLFPLEQAGIIGLLLFLLFLAKVFTTLSKSIAITRRGSVEYWFCVTVAIYIASSLVIGMSGHTFWRGFSTYNINSLRILLIVSAYVLASDYARGSRSFNRVGPR